MPQTLHLCRFNFADVDIRRVAATVAGGTSLSGIQDDIDASGGGVLRADFTNGFYRDRDGGLAWRLVSDLGTTTPVDVLLCAEKLFGPAINTHRAPHPPGPFTDGSEFVTSTDYTAAAAALRATTVVITGSQYALPLQPGILFSIAHPTWGWRAYRIQTLAGDGTATILPPLREAIGANTPLDFVNPRCQMKQAQQPSNPTNLGRTGTCTVTFVENMAKPS